MEISKIYLNNIKISMREEIKNVWHFPKPLRM